MANVNGTYYNFTIPPAPVGSARDITPIFTETFTPGALNDTRRLIKIPINVVIGAGSFFQVGDMDTGAALVLTMQVTDGTTTKTIIHQSTAGQAGGLARPTKAASVEDAIGFVINTNNFWLELLIATAAAGAQSAIFTYGLHMVGWAPSGIKS
jgi:hypothetical protein